MALDKMMIAALSSQVLNSMRTRKLKEKSITEFNRYGIRRIMAYFEKNEWVFYSRDAVWDFVLQERARMESGQLPAYQWAHTRRAAVYLEQMAEHGATQEVPLPKWEAEHNRLFKPVVQGEPPAQDMETLICQVRDAMIELELSKKAKQNYLYCGLGAVLKYFDSQGMTTYSRDLLDAFLADAQRKYLSGELKRAAWQNVRKSVLWIAEYQETGIISHCRLTDTLFEYASSDYERLIREYDSYIRADGYLKENTCYAYTTAVREFFRRMGSLGPDKYSQLTLLHVTNCISKTAEQVPLGIFNILTALRSFVRFIAEVHPELPDLSAAMICSPAKRRRVYVGYSDEEAQKILNEIDTSSAQGKRNYAMVMLAYGTGLRGCDIVNLKFENIDWQASEIRLTQEKTNIPLALPLDVTTGNAIAEYILHGRPACDSEYIFVRLYRPYTKLCSLWGVVAGYAHAALGESRKMNGPHAFRRGMGRRLLEAGVPSPMICDVLGHASADSLRQYTASSLECLKQCARTMEDILVMQEELL